MQRPILVLVALLLSCGGSPGGDAGALQDVLAGPHRSEENRARDVYRHPAETLAFFDFAPDLTVIEILPGGGWYTEILAPALKDRGRFIAANYGSKELAGYASVAYWVIGTFRYVGVLAIAMGLLRLARVSPVNR